jgi:hypothetical protein
MVLPLRAAKLHVPMLGGLLWQDGLYCGNRPGVGNGMRSIKAESFFSRTSKEINEGWAIQTLYSIE